MRKFYLTKVLLDTYTGLLVSLLFHFKEITLSALLFVLLLLSINLLCFLPLLLAQKANFRVLYILGKSKWSYLSENFVLAVLSLFASFFITEFLFYALASADTLILLPTYLLSMVLVLQSVILSNTLRKL